MDFLCVQFHFTIKLDYNSLRKVNRSECKVVSRQIHEKVKHIKRRRADKNI